MKKYEALRRKLGPSVLASIALIGAGCGSSNTEEKLYGELSQRLDTYELSGHFPVKGLVLARRTREEEVSEANKMARDVEFPVAAAVQLCATAAISGGELADISYGLDDLDNYYRYATYVNGNVGGDKYRQKANDAIEAAIVDCIIALPNDEITAPVGVSN